MKYLKVIEKEANAVENEYNTVYKAEDTKNVIFKPYEKYKWVDLGLSSGTKWSTINIGATSDTDYGLYFQWGKTKEKDTWVTPLDTSEWDGKNLTGGVLKPSVDAATANWGSKWRMPTKEDFDELIANTEYESTTINNVTGYKFTHKSDTTKYIFLPSTTNYWSSSLQTMVMMLDMLHAKPEGGLYTSGTGRYENYLVRGVLA